MDHLKPAIHVTPDQRPLRLARLIQPMQAFVQHAQSGGIVLLLVTLLALIIANSSLGPDSLALLANAWEFLFKAKIVYDNNDALEAIQATDHLGSPRRGRSGNLLTIDISRCLAILARHQQLSRNARTNLEMLLEVRDTAIHYLSKDRDFRTKVQEIGLASLNNYVTAVDAWFGKDLSTANFYLLPMSLAQAPETGHAPGQPTDQALHNLLAYFQTVEGGGKDPGDDRYAITLQLAPQFVRVSVTDAVPRHAHADEDAHPLPW